MKLINKNPSLVIIGITIVIISLGVNGFVAKNKCLIVGGRCISLEIVDTDATRELGLSGRQNMADDKAMLFVFETPAGHCFWMKDMKFNIDMVWLDQDRKIIKILPDVSPSSYPQSFCPDRLAKYVIELSSGVSRDQRLYLGQKLQF